MKCCYKLLQQLSSGSWPTHCSPKLTQRRRVLRSCAKPFAGFSLRFFFSSPSMISSLVWYPQCFPQGRWHYNSQLYWNLISFLAQGRRRVQLWVCTNTPTACLSCTGLTSLTKNFFLRFFHWNLISHLGNGKCLLTSIIVVSFYQKL